MKKETRISGAYEAPQCEVTYISLEECLLASQFSVGTEKYDTEVDDDDWL